MSLLPSCRYSLMLKCWAARPEDRPSFHEVVARLETMLTDKAGYVDLNINTTLEMATNLDSGECGYADPKQVLGLLQHPGDQAVIV